MQLEDRIALVTGGARGLGRGIALVLAERGADVAVCDINLDGARQTADEIGATGRKAKAYAVDVTSQAQLRDTVAAAIAEFGRIDILVNAAGVIGAPGFEDTTGSREEGLGPDLRCECEGHRAGVGCGQSAHERAALRQDSEHRLARRARRRRGRRRLRRVKGCRHTSHAVLCDGTRAL